MTLPAVASLSIEHLSFVCYITELLLYSVCVCVFVCVSQVMTAVQKGRVFLLLCIAKCASACQFPSRHC